MRGVYDRSGRRSGELNLTRRAAQQRGPSLFRRFVVSSCAQALPASTAVNSATAMYSSSLSQLTVPLFLKPFPSSILVVLELVHAICTRAPAFGATFRISAIACRFQYCTLGVKHFSAFCAFYNCHIFLSLQHLQLFTFCLLQYLPVFGDSF